MVLNIDSYHSLYIYYDILTDTQPHCQNKQKRFIHYKIVTFIPCPKGILFITVFNVIKIFLVVSQSCVYKGRSEQK